VQHRGDAGLAGGLEGGKRVEPFCSIVWLLLRGRYWRETVSKMLSATASRCLRMV